jgi:hypothetical protein
VTLVAMVVVGPVEVDFLAFELFKKTHRCYILWEYLREMPEQKMIRKF